MTRKLNFDQELREISDCLKKFQKRLNFIAKQGVNVDQVKTLIAEIQTNAQALAAKQSTTATDLSPALQQELIAALTPINELLKNAVVA